MSFDGRGLVVDGVRYLAHSISIHVTIPHGPGIIHVSWRCKAQETWRGVDVLCKRLIAYADRQPDHIVPGTRITDGAPIWSTRDLHTQQAVTWTGYLSAFGVEDSRVFLSYFFDILPPEAPQMPSRQVPIMHEECTES